MAYAIRHRIAASLCGVSLLFGIVGACAVGGGEGVDTDSSTTTNNGSGGTAGGPTAGGMGGTSNAGGMGGMLPPCSEDPCKLTAPQCGCPGGQKCSWANDMRMCEADGTAQEGEVCTSINVCSAGTQCLTTGGLAVCRTYCDSDMDCNGPGGLCVIEVSNGPNDVWEQKWCSDNCDPASSVGCVAAGAKCELGQEQGGAQRFFTLCLPAGAGTQSAPCPNGYSDCAAGYGCIGQDVNQNPICLQWCNLNSPQCNSGTCTNFPTPVNVGSISYGACL